MERFTRKFLFTMENYIFAETNKEEGNDKQRQS